MTWNYRVVEIANGKDSWLEICEVYYEGDKPIGYCTVSVGEDSIESLKDTLQRMTDCLNKPTLEKGTFNE